MIQKFVNVDWEIVTAAGVTVRTFDEEEMATEWLRERRESLPGAYVERVETVITRSRAYKPRLRVVA